MTIDIDNTIRLTPACFDDVDEFSAWENSLGWDVESTQLSAGANSIVFDHFAFPEMLVAHYTCKQSMRNVFAVPDGIVVLLIARCKLPAIWNGRNFPAALMAIVRSGLEHSDVMPAGWDCYEFVITEDLIRRAEIFPPGFLARTRAFEHAHVPLKEPVTQQFLAQLDTVFGLVKGATGSNGLPAVHSARLFDFIIDGLLQVVDTGLGADGTHTLRKVRSPELIEQATDLVDAHLSQNISIAGMAQTLGVSTRALNYAFRDSLGISPYQYVLTRKLHGMRRQLKLGDGPIAEIIEDHGFSTPSRFTRQYSRMFGELPSTTRNASRR